MRFCTFLACEHGPPRSFRRAPIEAFDQHRELRRSQSHRAARIAQRWPYEATLLQPLGEETEPVSVPEQDLDCVCLPAPEGKEMARERILLEHLLHHDCKAVESLSHVGSAERQVDLHAGRYDQHGPFSRSSMYRRTTFGSLP